MRRRISEKKEKTPEKAQLEAVLSMVNAEKARLEGLMLAVDEEKTTLQGFIQKKNFAEKDYGESFERAKKMKVEMLLAEKQMEGINAEVKALLKKKDDVNLLVERSLYSYENSVKEQSQLQQEKKESFREEEASHQKRVKDLKNFISELENIVKDIQLKKDQTDRDLAQRISEEKYVNAQIDTVKKQASFEEYKVVQAKKENTLIQKEKVEIEKLLSEVKTAVSFEGVRLKDLQEEIKKEEKALNEMKEAQLSIATREDKFQSLRLNLIDLYKKAGISINI